MNIPAVSPQSHRSRSGLAERGVHTKSRMDSTPASLLEQLKKPQHQAAWQRFAELYTPLLYYWARSQGLAEADAADLVQEVFVIVVTKLPTFRYDRDGSFRAWLRAVTLNKHRELKRKKTPQGLDPAFDQAQEDPLRLLEEKEHRQYLVQQMLQMVKPEFPPSTWQLFDAYVMQRRTPQEIAASHKISITTVYAAKCKVLQRLRIELDGLLN
jgi:RNA polymerase sigma-70 factor (ECF subfamily)